MPRIEDKSMLETVANIVVADLVNRCITHDELEYLYAKTDAVILALDKSLRALGLLNSEGEWSAFFDPLDYWFRNASRKFLVHLEDGTPEGLETVCDGLNELAQTVYVQTHLPRDIQVEQPAWRPLGD
jgi:hypothetical protein